MEPGVDGASVFPFKAKLMLLCSPLFLSFPNYWRLLTQEQLTRVSSVDRLSINVHYLAVEIVFSGLSMSIAMLADSTIGVKFTFLSFLLVTWLPGLACTLAGVTGVLEREGRITLAEFGINMIGIYVVCSVVERAYFSSQLSARSPYFRIYFFLCYYFSILWQVIHASTIFFPRAFTAFFNARELIISWFNVWYNCILWTLILSTYIAIAHLDRHSKVPVKGISFKMLVCVYLAVYYACKVLADRMRWKDTNFQNVFEACEQCYPRDIVVKMKRVFKLFVITMCLMYLYGLELILRSIWSHQDESLTRKPKPSLWTIFPMEMILLFYLCIVFPFVEFVVLPFLRKRYMNITDLRLLGVALVFYNLAFVATMALEWSIMSSRVSSPTRDNIAFRIFNTMIYPVSWTIAHPGIADVGIFLPGRTSRAYINDVIGEYTLILNSSVFNMVENVELARGTSAMYVLKDAKLSRLPDIEAQLEASPDFHAAATHLFILNGLVDSSASYLAEKQVEVALQSEAESELHTISDNVTHTVLFGGLVDIILYMGNKTFEMKQQMNDQGVYCLMFYDSWSGIDEGFDLVVVSVGFVVTQLWAHIQILLLAIGMSVGYIPMFCYIYKNAPPELMATCFSFQRCALAMSTFFVWCIVVNYGLGTAPSTISMMIVFMFTLFFVFISVSDIIPDEELLSENDGAETYDELTSHSGSLKLRPSVYSDAASPEPDTKSPDSDSKDPSSDDQTKRSLTHFSRPVDNAVIS